MREFQLPIAGRWTTPAEVDAFDEVMDPYRGEPFARVPLASARQMEAALEAAGRAFAHTRRMPTHRRVTILEGIVAGLRQRSEELAETITRECGKPIAQSRAEVARAIQTFTLGGDAARAARGELLPVDLEPRTEGYDSLFRRFPIGPVAAIAPFNFPLNLVAHKVAPAIAVGCPVVLKPPMQAPVTSLLLAEICYDAGLPMDALSVVHSRPEVAQALATDERIRLLSFTGSAKVGWHLKSIAGTKRVVLELGGNAGAIVHEDADLAWAAKRCAVGAFAAAGQVCIRVQRLLVHGSVLDRFTEAFAAATRALPVGDPMLEETVVGPMIDAAAADRVMSWIDEAVQGGARLLLGGTRAGNVIQPTILTGTRADMKVEREEIFGPAVTLRAYDDFEDAIRLTNEGVYGLQAGVFTYDVRRIARAFEDLDVGGVIANDYPTLRVDNFPYGGVKESGFGREGVRFAAEDMTEMKALVLRLSE